MNLLYVFYTPYDQYKEHNTKLCRIVKVYDEVDDRHDEEALPMFDIVFEDGTKIEAYPEELVPYGEDK